MVLIDFLHQIVTNVIKANLCNLGFTGRADRVGGGDVVTYVWFLSHSLYEMSKRTFILEVCMAVSP